MKKIIIASLGAILLVAALTSVYNASANRLDRSSVSAVSDSPEQPVAQIQETSPQAAVNPAPALQSITASPDASALQPQPTAAPEQQAYAAAAVAGQSNLGGTSQGRGRQRGGQKSSSTDTGLAGSQQVSMVSGIVSAYAAPQLTLQTNDGQVIYIQLGNIQYLESMGLVLSAGDAVSVTGFTGLNGDFAATQLTLEDSGQVFTLRSQTGRPDWAGKK